MPLMRPLLLQGVLPLLLLLLLLLQWALLLLQMVLTTPLLHSLLTAIQPCAACEVARVLLHSHLLQLHQPLLL